LKAYSLASIAALSDRIQEHFEQERKEDDIGKAYKSFCSLGRLVVKKNVDLVCNPEQSIQQVRALEDVAFVALLHFFALLCAPYPSNNVIRYVARSLSSFLSVVDGGTRKHLANDTKSCFATASSMCPQRLAGAFFCPPRRRFSCGTWKKFPIFRWH